jgi:hypothetical protein
LEASSSHVIRNLPISRCPGDTKGDTKRSTVFVIPLAFVILNQEDRKQVIGQAASSGIGNGTFVNIPGAYFGGEVL